MIDKIARTLRLEEEMITKVNYIAKEKRRTVNAQIECIIQEYIEEYEAENGIIQLSEDEKFAYRK